MQPSKLVLVVRVPKIVEAGAEDGQAQVAVSVQEPGQVLRTAVAGAPGGVPGDPVLLTGRQHFQYVGVEPVQEAFFSMEAAILGKKGESMMGGEEQVACGQIILALVLCLRPSPSSFLNFASLTTLGLAINLTSILHLPGFSQ